MVLTAQTSFTEVTNGRPFSHAVVHTDEIVKLSTKAIFRARETSVATRVLERMDRRDRIVLILLDGRRTVDDVTSLLHRNEAEITQVLVRLLKSGHIDYVGNLRV